MYQQYTLFATQTIFVCEMMVGTETKSLFFILETKSGENKIYRVKWKSPENVRMKMYFCSVKKKASFTCENLQIFRQIRITSSKFSLKNK